ncbi:MAG: SRPBCC domain-containing protein [Bacteroidia bacterium]
MDSIQLEKYFSASAQTVYNSWLRTDGHSKMTGGEAQSEPIEGSEYMAWDNYIFGKHLELKPYAFIKQTWRSTEFNDNDQDSIVEIRLEDTDKGCKMVLKHFNIPSGQGKRYESGWVDHYFSPMDKYFGTI